MCASSSKKISLHFGWHLSFTHQCYPESTAEPPPGPGSPGSLKYQIWGVRFLSAEQRIAVIRRTKLFSQKKARSFFLHQPLAQYFNFIFTSCLGIFSPVSVPFLSHYFSFIVFKDLFLKLPGASSMPRDVNPKGPSRYRGLTMITSRHRKWSYLDSDNDHV